MAGNPWAEFQSDAPAQQQPAGQNPWAEFTPANGQGRDTGALSTVGDAFTGATAGSVKGPIGKILLNSVVLPEARDELPVQLAKAKLDSPKATAVGEWVGEHLLSPEAALAYGAGQFLKLGMQVRAMEKALEAEGLPLAVKAANAGAARMKWTSNAVRQFFAHKLGIGQAAEDAVPGAMAAAGAVAGHALGGKAGAAIGALGLGGRAAIVDTLRSPALLYQAGRLAPYAAQEVIPPAMERLNPLVPDMLRRPPEAP